MKTPLGQVLEFQYSYIKPAEVRSREAFYEALVWVVNGWRRDGDRAALPSRWEETKPVTENGSVRRIRTKGERLIRDWGQSQVEVFFGFQESNKADDGSDRMLWWLHRPPGAKWSHVAPYPLPEFVARYGSASASAEIGPDPLIDSFEREAKADIAELEGLYDWRGPSDTPDAPRRPLGDLQDPAEREAVRASREKNLKRAIRMVKESQRRADGAG
ncbi:MAG: hypothetical protein NXI30_04055 [bacterium]|nr:hypothetical protein [bacterium]